MDVPGTEREVSLGAGDLVVVAFLALLLLTDTVLYVRALPMLPRLGVAAVAILLSTAVVDVLAVVAIWGLWSERGWAWPIATTVVLVQAIEFVYALVALGGSPVPTGVSDPGLLVIVLYLRFAVAAGSIPLSVYLLYPSTRARYPVEDRPHVATLAATLALVVGAELLQGVVRLASAPKPVVDVAGTRLVLVLVGTAVAAAAAGASAGGLLERRRWGWGFGVVTVASALVLGAAAWTGAGDVRLVQTQGSAVAGIGFPLAANEVVAVLAVVLAVTLALEPVRRWTGIELPADAR